MIGLVTADSGAGKKSVVPFNGREVRLGTNPISIAVPSNQEAPVFLDMATSVVAAGKVGIARARNKKIPEGWILDVEGNPSTRARRGPQKAWCSRVRTMHELDLRL